MTDERWWSERAFVDVGVVNERYSKMILIDCRSLLSFSCFPERGCR